MVPASSSFTGMTTGEFRQLGQSVGLMTLSSAANAKSSLHQCVVLFLPAEAAVTHSSVRSERTLRHALHTAGIAVVPERSAPCARGRIAIQAKCLASTAIIIATSFAPHL